MALPEGRAPEPLLPPEWLAHGLKPMLAGTSRPFDSADHLFDAKWDGLRSIAFFGPTVRLQARSLRDQTRHFPELAAALAELPGAGVLDGEIVVMDGDRSSFPLVMERNRIRPEAAIRRAAANAPAWFVAFDLLHRDGARLTTAPLLERRRALNALLPDSGGHIFANPLIIGEGLRFFGAMRERNMEGMVAKRLQSPYRIGERSDDWLKIKIRPRLSCVVFGTLHRSPDGPLRSLVVGAYGPDGPVWLGNVGSGLDNTTRTQLSEQLRSLECPAPSGFGATGDGYIRYVRPLLVVSVEYLELTPSGHLRHPAFVGFEDRDPRSCRPPAGSGGSPD